MQGSTAGFARTTFPCERIWQYMYAVDKGWRTYHICDIWKDMTSAIEDEKRKGRVGHSMVGHCMYGNCRAKKKDEKTYKTSLSKTHLGAHCDWPGGV